ncbi:MAG TPA: presqualene diphosphate synthase HpnD [Actinomycetota bacterium]
MTPAAVAYCEGVTRTRARNFWYGIRLLPRPKREALAAVYALARRIDDVGDDDLPEAEKRRGLDVVERSLVDIGPGSPDPVLAALGLAGRRFDLPVQAFRDLIDGVRMDLDGTRYGTFEELVVYCRRVAGSVGRLSLSVFGAPYMAAAEPLADDLGVAMQLANVLRDVREDLGRGRVYLPAEDLERFGCSPGDLAGPAGPRVEDLIRFEAARAEDWFRRGLRLLPMLDRRSAACAGAMAGIYRRLLRRISARPGAVLDRRVSLPAWEKAYVAARALAGPPSIPREAAA